VPQDINPDSSAKSAPVGSESPRVDKPPSPPTEKTMPESPQAQKMHKALLVPVVLHPLPPVPPRATTLRVLLQAQSQPSPPKRLPQAPGPMGSGPPSPRSMPQSEKPPQRHSWVVEFLWDNLEFIQASFHIRQFVTAAIDTEADQENIKAFYVSLKSTSAQINVSA
jgi:hypothetical protein